MKYHQRYNHIKNSENMNPLRRNVANGVTCVNVLCGTLAILCCTLTPAQCHGWLGPQGWAVLFILLAVVADFADGLVARAMHTFGPLGKELDSLSDLVSFGVAPCVLVWSSLRDAGMDGWWLWSLALIPVCGAVRLAKFNIDTRQTTSFLGLPIPANAIFWIGYAATMLGGARWLGMWWALVPAVLALCSLMVCELPLMALKFKSYGLRGNMPRWSLVGGCAVILVCLGVPGLMWMILYYVALSIAERFCSSGTH